MFNRLWLTLPCCTSAGANNQCYEQQTQLLPPAFFQVCCVWSLTFSLTEAAQALSICSLPRAYMLCCAQGGWVYYTGGYQVPCNATATLNALESYQFHAYRDIISRALSRTLSAFGSFRLSFLAASDE